MQRIVIKNFGPIKDVDIPIHDFMIFIGPQASGKSTIAKAIYFFIELPYDIVSPLDNKIRNKISHSDKESITSLEDIKQTIREKVREKVFRVSMGRNFELSFVYDENISIQIDVVDYEIKVVFSDQLEKKIESFLETILLEFEYDLPDIKQEIQRKRGMRRVISTFLTETFKTKYTQFVPSGRNIFSVLSNQIQFFEKSDIDYSITQYANQINMLRQFFGMGYFREYGDGTTNNKLPDDTLSKKLVREILKGDYARERELDEIFFNNDDLPIRLSDASSGQQESLWALLSIIDLLETAPSYLIIEEPETHLYPESQKHIAELITLVVNREYNQAVITTHSPYILSAINNLLYANEVGKKFPEQVEKVVDRNLWLDYDRVMTYFVDKGGVRPIMDEEMKMIKSEEIDSASRIINEQYSDLADIEFSK
jgi:predicted ATPase